LFVNKKLSEKNTGEEWRGEERRGQDRGDIRRFFWSMQDLDRSPSSFEGGA